MMKILIVYENFLGFHGSSVFQFIMYLVGCSVVIGDTT